MDPLSVGASIVGLITAGLQISNLISRIRECPELARSIISELSDISAVLAPLQELICGHAQTSTIRPASAEPNIVHPPELAGSLVQRYAFQDDLDSSRVYNRAIYRHSQISLTSTALYTTAISVFSKLSLSQVSNISFYALPICAVDLINSECYVFGGEGALPIDSTREIIPPNESEEPPIKVSQSTIFDEVASDQSTSAVIPAKAKQRSFRLLGRFALPQRRIRAARFEQIIEISEPTLVETTANLSLTIRKFKTQILEPSRNTYTLWNSHHRQVKTSTVRTSTQPRCRGIHIVTTSIRE
jgi:hypothetical protein